MRAEPAIDPEGFTVYYYFDCVSGAVPDSGWIADNEWYTNVPFHSPYSYTVKYGDAPTGGNVSVASPVGGVIWMD
jgi:hypothetical protein